jgi:hypothetical protein
LAIANAKVIKGTRGEAEEIADALLSAAADGGERVAASAV